MVEHVTFTVNLAALQCTDSDVYVRSVYGDDSTDQSGRRKKARRPGGSAKTQEDILTEQRKARADARAALVPPLPSPGEGPNPEAEPTEHPIPDPLLNGPDNPSSENQEEDAA